jgi:hypothetical protein
MMVHGLCSDLEDSIAKFVHDIGKLDEDSVSVAKSRRSMPQKDQSTKPLNRQEAFGFVAGRCLLFDNEGNPISFKVRQTIAQQVN